MARVRYTNMPSPEYIETLVSWLQTWVAEDDSLIFAQFLKRHKIGWSYFDHFMTCSPLLCNEYEIALATLCERWFLRGMKAKELPDHVKKIYARYLAAYDQHLRHMKKEDNKELAEASKPYQGYTSENYSQAPLDGAYKKIYESNLARRRSEAEAK